MPREVTLRPATRMDLDDMFRWRSDPEIYQWFRNQNEALDWGEHVRWFQNRPDEREDLIIEYLGGAVGVVSFAEDGDVGIYIGEKRLWGKGVASDALSKALESRRKQRRTAEIHHDNVGSQRLFEQFGFEKCGKDGDWIQYELNTKRWVMENESGFMQGDGSLHVNEKR